MASKLRPIVEDKAIISHKYKCIFIHIPRVAGSSIEKWIYGKDWWSVRPATKHLLASQAKERYTEYWEEYFTFAFVRNPWDRVVSGLKFPGYFGIHYRKNSTHPFNQWLEFDQYQETFGEEVVLEYDHRYYRRENLISEKHEPGQIYGNILDERLDFIGRFENLKEDCELLREILRIESQMDVHIEKSRRSADYREYFNQKAIERVGKLYQKDIERFNYEY